MVIKDMKLFRELYPDKVLGLVLDKKTIYEYKAVIDRNTILPTATIIQYKEGTPDKIKRLPYTKEVQDLYDKEIQREIELDKTGRVDKYQL